MYIIGAVEIGKDMKEIEKLVRSISQARQITFSDFIGISPAIREVISFAQKIAATDSVISIRGASGTGKELLAYAIHTESERTGPFIPINCAALPEPLLESELFGYVGGSFTGARKEGKKGLFETANHGTILLDEIAEMPLGSQAKILRVIQERSVRKIGGAQEVPVNTRIITASNKNLEEFVNENLFREDLYYRINVLPIHIPPLRERIEDVTLLTEHFLFQLASKLGKNVQSLTKEAYNKLSSHNWPGNVRELKNVIERAAILCNSEPIGAEHILFSFEIDKRMQGIKKVLHHDIADHHTLQSLIDGYEKQIINQTLQASLSIRKAAKKLGVSHTTLLNKMKKHHIRQQKQR